MKSVQVTRFYGNEKQMLGVISVIENGKLIWFAKTLELAWKNNEPKISCIPEGVYNCKFTYSPAFNKFLYEIISVPNRAGIRIHSANYYKQLLGCVALGNSLKDLNMDGEMDTIHSGNTVLDFEKLMNEKEFLLTIKQAI